MRHDTKIYVEELVIAESGTYTDQFLRPYVTELGGSLVDRIEERFQKSRRFTPSILASIANQFMVPDHRPRGVIEVPHGWSERRGRFLLTIGIEIGNGDKLRQVIIGYTNSVGFTLRNVDPDMEFYINSTFLLTKKTVRGSRGYFETWVPSHSSDVLSDRESAGLRRRGPEMYTMRPEDVYSTIDAEQTTSLVNDVTDLRTTLSKNAVKSSTSNRLGSRYMANVLSSRQKALDNAEYGQSVIDINASAQGYVQESYTSDDLFMRAISNLRNLTTTVDNFTYRDLEDIDPDVENRTNNYLLDNDARGATRFAEDSNAMDGQEEEDRIAALIAVAIPALMMETGIHSIKFQVHNQGLDAKFTFVPTDAKSFIPDVELGPFIEKFEERMIDELLYPITGDNQFDLGLKVSCNIFGEVDFTLYWDGANRGRFIIPCFCNSISSPVVTDSRNDIKKLSRDFSDLFDQFLPSDAAGGGVMGGRGFSY